MKKNKHITTILLIVAFALIVGSYFGYGYWKRKHSKSAAAPAAFSMPVVAIKIEAGNMSEEIGVVGTLEANKSAIIKSEVAGKVNKIDFAEGKFIKKGGLLAKIDDSNYESDLQRAKAAYELAAANNKRAVALFKVEAISKESKESSHSVAKQAKANYDLAKSKMDKTSIKAPFSGMVSFRNVNIGDLVLEGVEITKIVDITKVKVEFSIAEKYQSKLKVGEPVYSEVDAYPGVNFKGEIYAIDPIIDPDTRTIHVKAIINNDEGKLQPGMTAYVKIKLATKDAIVIPEEAIVSGDKKISIFKIIDGIAKESDVVIGQRLNGMVEITDGISIGDQIITSGQMKIRDGMPVSAQDLKK